MINIFIIAKIVFVNLFINIISAYIYNSNPILLIPGLGGSRLIKYDQLNSKNIDIWPPTSNYFMFNYKKWAKKFKIEYDDINNKLIYDPSIKTLEFGNNKSFDLKSVLPYIFPKNVYDDIMDEYNNIYSIPYDFRLMHSGSYLDNFNTNLSSYIEQFNKPVILLTHSSGGLITHNFLHAKDDIWKNKYIKSVINVNVPFGGLLIALEGLATESKYNKIISKDIIQSVGGIIINQPNKFFFNSILKVDNKEIDDYLTYFKLNKIKILYENTDQKKLRELFIKSHNVKTEIVYTSNINTPTSLEIINGKIKIVDGLGDGIIPLCSLLVPKLWNHNDIKFSCIDNYQHSDILFSQELKTIINEHLI
jgi:hypothetical protein